MAGLEGGMRTAAVRHDAELPGPAVSSMALMMVQMLFVQG